MWKASRRALTAIAVLTAIGCGGGDDGSGPTGSISLSASPSSLTLPQGGSGTVTVTLVRGGGFADPVNVAVTGLPAGVTLSVTPAQLTGVTNQATVTVNVANTVPAGTYTATVTATATGIGSATATYTLTVTALPTFSLTATPAAVSIGQGGSGTSTIGVVRTNFTGAVALTLVSPPAGITGSFNPTPATGDQSVLTINVAGTVGLGNHTLTVNGSSAGQTDKTTTVTLTVLPPPNYQLSTTPNAVSIPAGATGTTTVNIDRTNFTGAVTLALDAPPQGITATFNPAAPTGNTSTATISVPANAALGTYNVTIKGTASGVSGGDRTTTVAVTVTAAATFTIAATPASLTIGAGASSNTSVAIVRTNFTTDVALSLVSPPTGITGVFTPATLTGATLTSNLVVSVAASVGAGTHTLTVQGVGGSLTKTATIALTVTVPPDFTISATPAALSIGAGASGNTSVAIVRTNFTTDVALSLVSPPTGISGVFTPATLTGATLTSNLVISVAASVGAGPQTLTVQGVGGSITKTATVTVTVTAAAASVTLSMTPATLSIQQGGSSTSTLNAVRTNYTGNITPSFTGAPAGMTLTFDPNPITSGNSSTVTVNVGASTAVGTHNVTITGASGAAGNPTTTLAVTVTSPGSGANVTWEFCNTPANGVPVKFWRLSGGTWAEVTGAVVGSVTRFAFTVSAGSAGVAYTTGSSVFNTTVFFYQSTELVGASPTCTAVPATVQKTFNVSGLGQTEGGFLSYGGGFAPLNGFQTSYNLNVVPGTYDWLASFGTINQSTFAFDLTNYRIGRNEVAPGAAVAVARASAPAFVTTPFTLTGGGTTGTYGVVQSLQGANGSVGFLSVAAASTGNLLFPQPGDRLSTDLWAVFGTYSEVNMSSLGDIQFTTRYVGSGPPANATFALPQKVPAFTVSQVNGAPVTTWMVTGGIPTDYQATTSSLTSQFIGQGNNNYTMNASRAWLVANSMSASYTLTGPNLPNFLQAWAPAAPLSRSTVSMAVTNATGPVLTAGIFFNGASRSQ